LKYEVLIQQAISHHPFITTSFYRWQNKGSIYQRELLSSICSTNFPDKFVFNHSVTEFISEGEIFHKIKHFTHKLVQFYIAELAIVIGELSHFPSQPNSKPR
jgi:hypothetical protein